MEDIVKATALKTELDSLRPINEEQGARIMQKFRLDWNYHSNNLEGNSLTYGETKALLMHGITAQGKPLKDHFEVTGHNEAINWVTDIVKGNRPLTEKFIRELHTLLLKEPYEVDAITADGKPTKKKIAVGSYKTTPNHVKTKTGEIFYFATPEETPAKMTDLLAWYNQKIEDEDVNPILLAAEFHYEFIRIHPFEDGNGRTARILMNFILMKLGYPPVIVKTEDKENYFAALRLADTGNLNAFITYIAKNAIHSLQIMIAGAKGESIEEPDDIDKEITLLEKRLAEYGNRIDKEKSEETVNDIYINTIVKLARVMRLKLQRFEKHYLNTKCIISFIGEGVPSIWYRFDELPSAIQEVRDIRIELGYYSIKKEGLENHSFHYDVYFEFNQLNYTVSLDRKKHESVYTKFYDNLSNDEIEFIVKDVVKKYKYTIENLLSNN